MTQTLYCLSTLGPSLTISSPVTQCQDSTFLLSAPPSATEVKQRQGQESISRFCFGRTLFGRFCFASNEKTLLDLNVKAKREERRRKSNEEVSTYRVKGLMPKAFC
jgi:hypothetical protein